MAICLKAIYRFNAVPMKVSLTSFTELEKSGKIRMEPHKCQIAKAILSKKKDAGNNTTPSLQIPYRVTVVS